MDSEASPIPPYAYLAVLIVICMLKWHLDPLNAIPTVGGSSLPVLSYWTAWRFKKNPTEIITEGYRKYPDSVFKVAMFHRWVVIVNGSRLLDDLRKWTNDDVMSMSDVLEDLTRSPVLLGHKMTDDSVLGDIVRENLGRALPAMLPCVVDELTTTIPQLIRAKNAEWVTLPTLILFQETIAHIINRVSVGIPLCRNEGYLQVATDFILTLMRRKHMIDFYPDWLKWTLRPFYPRARQLMHEAIRYLKPLIDERKEMREVNGDEYDGKPNDMLQWIMDDAFATNNISDWVITRRLLVLQLASIHTTSTSLSLVMYRLAASAEYVQALREEIEPIIAADGWTKAAFSKMCKVDSFLHESQRCDNLGMGSIARETMEDVTLSNGTFLPAGTQIMAAAYAIYHDDAVYSSADTFDPFRFSRVCQANGSETCKQGYVTTSYDNIAFGHGKRACPGRFFAAIELKAILAYILINYDIQLPGDGRAPGCVYDGTMLSLDPQGKIMFRKRQA